MCATLLIWIKQHQSECNTCTKVRPGNRPAGSTSADRRRPSESAAVPLSPAEKTLIIKFMNKQHGFTLVELLITIVVATILVALAVPAFHNFVQNNRITAQVNELITALTLVRSEAIKRKQTITICSSSDGSTCTGAWDQGWIIFTDANGNGTVDAGTEDILRVREGLTGGATLVETASLSSIQFDRLGSASVPANFQLRIPDCKGDQARDITLLVTGRTDVSRVSCP